MTTKFNPGQEVWIIHNNKPQLLKIDNIKIETKEELIKSL